MGRASEDRSEALFWPCLVLADDERSGERSERQAEMHGLDAEKQVGSAERDLRVTSMKMRVKNMRVDEITQKEGGKRGEEQKGEPHYGKWRRNTPTEREH